MGLGAPFSTALGSCGTVPSDPRAGTFGPRLLGAGGSVRRGWGLAKCCAVTLRPLFSVGAGGAARRRPAGQSTVEWLGIVVAVAVLALTVIAAAPGVASSVGAGMERIVCTVGSAAGSGASCPSPAPERAAVQTQARTVIEATGRGGLRPDAAAAGGLKDNGRSRPAAQTPRAAWFRRYRAKTPRRSSRSTVRNAG